MKLLVYLGTLVLTLLCCQSPDTKAPQKPDTNATAEKKEEPTPKPLSATKPIANSNLPPYVIKNYTKFLERIRSNQKAEIAKLIREYPVKRPNQLLHNEEEFVAYYDQLFDSTFINKLYNIRLHQRDFIVKSDMYGVGSGFIWFYNNGEIMRINYKPEHELKAKAALQESIKNRTHPSAQNYDKNIVRCETDKFIVHINYSKEDGHSYTSWSKPKATSEEPDLMLKKGIQEYQGTMGGIHYTFKNGPWTYQIAQNNMAEDDETGYYLRVYHNDELKVEQKAVRVTE